MAIEEIRVKIDHIDSEIAALLKERMGLSEEVAKAKADRGPSAVYVKSREEEVLKRAEDAVGDKAAAECVFRSVMLASRKLQYEKICAGKRCLGQAAEFKDPARIICQGRPGAYSEEAAEMLFPGKKINFVTEFSDVFESCATDGEAYGVLPIYNTIAGGVGEIYDMLEKSGLYINSVIDVPVKHALLCLPGASLKDIKTVYSHGHALKQCSKLIKSMRLSAVALSNTAAAAERVAKEKDITKAALASPAAGHIYGLNVLAAEAADTVGNTTRFVSVGKKLMNRALNNEVAVAFVTDNEAGALAKALQIFGVYGVNLTGLMSRPIPERPFEYSFYADFTGNLTDSRVEALLAQLSAELFSLKILGTCKK